MSEVTFSSAKQNLHSILQQPAFHQTKQVSWWEMVWHFIATHLHISLSVHSLTPIAAAIAVLVAVAIVVGIVLLIVFRFRNKSWRLVERQLSQGRGQSLEERLQAAIRAESWTQAMHLLVALGIQYAQSEHWLLDKPYKTARTCLREMRDLAEPAFSHLFEDLVGAAEQALFARQSVSPETVQRLSRELESWLRKVST